MSARVCVTGASGKAGRAIVAELVSAGFEVSATDRTPPRQPLGVPVLLAELTDYGQAVEVVAGADAVVHMANIPAPGIHTQVTTLEQNTTMNANVFFAAQQLGVRRVVWASSETTLGLPFDVPPRYAPLDESHFPLPTSSYALSKVLTEDMAHHISDWSGIVLVGLRISNIMEPHEYAGFQDFWPDAHLRKWNLWSYVDARDVALATRLALTADLAGSHNIIIAAADTVMDRPSQALMTEVFPEVPIVRPLAEQESLESSDLARSLIGYRPQHSWRDHLSKTGVLTTAGANAV